MKNFFFILLIPLMLSADKANVISSDVFYNYDDLFDKAERAHNVPKVLLKAIALTESEFNEKALHINSNDTEDVGLMQINSIWKKSYGITDKELIDPSINIDTSAKILNGLIIRHGYSWDTIGRYHSSTPKYKKRWLKKVKSNIKLIMKYDKKEKYRMVSK